LTGVSREPTFSGHKVEEMRSIDRTRTSRPTGAAASRRSRATIAGALAGVLACFTLVTACAASSPGSRSERPNGSTPSQATLPVNGCGGAAGTNDPPAPSPACSIPGPTDAPWRVSEAQAIAAAGAFAGLSDLAVTRTWGSSTSPFRLYLVQDATHHVLVDGTTGTVVEAFGTAPDIVPGPDDPPAWSPAPAASPDVSKAARDAAASTGARYLGAHDLSVTGTAASVELQSLGSPVWVLTWTDSAGAPFAEVVVEAATGKPVGFVDRRFTGTPLTLPLVDRDTAVRLAIARANADHGQTAEQISSVELQLDFPATGPSNAWLIGLGVPKPDPSAGGTVWYFGTFIAVDAATGAVTVVK
jgi:hypothetical protein